MENTGEKKSKTIGEYFRSLRPLSFLRELLVVILGILITFGINAWIVRNSRQETLKGTLRTVVTELEQNRKSISDMDRNFEIEEHVFAMIRECFAENSNLLEIHADTLLKYQNIALAVRMIRPKSDALTVLQNANLIPFINKPELIADLFECYSMLESVRETVGFYASKKNETIQLLIDNMDSSEPLYKKSAREYWEWLLSNEVYRNLLFFTSPIILTDIKDVNDQTVLLIDELIARIREEYRLEN